MSYGEFADYLAASLDVMARQVPTAYSRLCAALEHRPIHFRSDGSEFGIESSDTALSLCSPPSSSVLEVTLSKDIVVDLLNGKSSLYEAVRDERLLLKGSVSDLSFFFHALQIYVRGAIRSPGMAPLLSTYCSTNTTRRI